MTFSLDLWRHPRRGVRSVAVALALLLVAPPNLWAQLPPPASSATMPQQPTQSQPFISSPGALAPIAPSLAQCPTPRGISGGTTQKPNRIRPGAVGGTAGGSQGPGATATTGGGLGEGSTGASTGAAPRGGSDSRGGGAIALPMDEGVQDLPEMSIEESFGKLLVLEGTSGTLHQFGYSYFQSPPGSLTQPGDAPPGPDYVVGPDDTVSIQIWNVPDAALNRSFLLTVERDGTIYIPQVGAIAIAGLTMADAQKQIEARMRRLIKRFDMHMNIARLRTMKVFVVGEVVRPGAYDVSSLATVSYGLHAACGPSRAGSLRKIRVVRAGKQVAELDFYRFFLQGDRTQDVHLKAGDTILVPPIGPVTAIAGPVRRPAIYELPGPTPLSSVIELAGGLQPTADRRRAQIFRVEPGRQRAILDVGKGIARPEAREPLIQDGDFVRINAIWTSFENTVTLGGAVRNPGAYAFRKGMRLSELVRAEQLTPDSYMDRGEILRTDPITYGTTLLTFHVGRLLAGDQAANFELQRLDRVTIGSQARGPETVTVAGEVWRPGAYPKRENERLSSLLERAGGFTPRAFPRGAVLVRPSVRAHQQAELQLFIQQQRQQAMAESAAYTMGATETATSAAGAMTENAALQARLAALNELARRPDLGRVVITLESIEKLKGSPDDLILEPGDEVTIPLRPQTVSVLGAVRHPSAFAVTSSLSGKDYVKLAGGPTEHGQVGEAYVVHPNGSTDLSISDVSVGDAIIVPERIEPKTRTLPLVTAVAAIIASLATTTLALYLITK